MVRSTRGHFNPFTVPKGGQEGWEVVVVQKADMAWAGHTEVHLRAVGSGIVGKAHHTEKGIL